MHEDLKNYRRYLENRLAEFSSSPELCPNSIDVYKKYIRWLDESKTEAEFESKVKNDGHMFSVAKAEELDKRYSLFTLHKKFNHEKAAIAAELRYKTIEAATDYVSLNKSVTAVTQTANAMDVLENSIHDAILELFGSLTAYIIKNSKEKSDALKNVKLCWEKALSLDENLSWKKICFHPPFRRRFIFDEARLTEYEKILEKANG